MRRQNIDYFIASRFISFALLVRASRSIFNLRRIYIYPLSAQILRNWYSGFIK